MKKLASLFSMLLFAAATQATVTNVAWYRLGENDAGGVSGLTVTNTTADFVGVNHLKQFGSPLYTNAVSVAASNRVGSSLAVSFNGSSQFFSNAVVSLATNNFGIELWVRPDTTNAGPPYFIAVNGNSAGGGSSGWGIFQQDRDYRAVFPGVVVFGSFGTGTATPGIWDHLALVRDGGTSTLYVNGASVATSALNPRLPTIGFALGTHPNLPAGEFFGGAIDEVRVFTFAPGQFSTNDLLFSLQRAVTLAATGIGATNATLNGISHPVGLSTSAWFEWGTTTNYGNSTPPQPFGGGTSNTNFSYTLGGLGGGVMYHFRTVGSNSLGVAFGEDQNFSTPPYMDINAGLTGVTRSAVAWGDYDNDGRLDFILTGATNINLAGVVLGAISQVWRNTTNGFTNVTSLVAPGLPGVARGSVAWGDYDNDGWLDFLLTGYTPAPVYCSQIWRNTGTGFTNMTAMLAPGLTEVAAGSVAWGDYDHDGRLDFLLTGFSPVVGNVSQLWRNTGSGFTNTTLAATSGLGLPGVEYSSVSWVDYDHDGWLDFLLMGVTNNNLLVLADGRGLAQLWRNTGQTFVDVTTAVLPGLPALVFGSAAWGDADNDGRPDLLVTGYIVNTGLVAQVWRNTGGAFTNLNAGLPGVYFGSTAWGDYDNDGRPDILLTGVGASANLLGQVWRNTGGSFTNLNAGLPGVAVPSVAWADFDNDGRLDFLLTGSTNNNWTTNFVSQVWRNSSPVTNTPPSAPTGLAMTVSAPGALLSWNSSTDAQTPSTGLSYNVRAGTTPGGTNLIAAHVNGATGFRRVPALGNAQLRLSLPLAGVTNGQIVYWSVQAVDSAFAGGPFATETSVVSLPQLSITPGGATNAIVSWKPPTWGWHLQERTNLATAAWGDSPSGELNPATLPAAPQRYYRLRWP